MHKAPTTILEKEYKILTALEDGTFEVPENFEEQVAAMALAEDYPQYALLILEEWKDEILAAVNKGTNDITQLSIREQKMLFTTDSLLGLSIQGEDLEKRGIDEEAFVDIVSRLTEASGSYEPIDFLEETSGAVKSVLDRDE